MPMVSRRLPRPRRTRKWAVQPTAHPNDRLQSRASPFDPRSPMTLRTRFFRRTLVAAILRWRSSPAPDLGGRRSPGRRDRVAVADAGAWQELQDRRRLEGGFSLAATLPGNLVPIEIAAASALPAGAKVVSRPGVPASARFTWSPSAKQAGVHQIGFAAAGPGLASAPLRSVTIRVVAIEQALLSDRATEIYRWAYVTRRTSVRSVRRPVLARSAQSSTVTPEYFPNLVQTLNVLRYPNGETWVRVRIASLPNSKTGWVRRGKLGRYWKVNTRLLVSRSGLRATLYRRGKPISERPSASASHAGRRLRRLLRARDPVGLQHARVRPHRLRPERTVERAHRLAGRWLHRHSRDEPARDPPGRVSHGCIRMRNSAVLRLRRLMPLGTPVQVR